MESLINEMNRMAKLRDNRLLVLILHLYMEYWVNEIIIKMYPKSEVILDENTFNQLKGFTNKVKLIEASNIITNPEVIGNVKILNRIRNLYAHNLDQNSITKKVEKEIGKMVEFEGIKHGPIEKPFAKLQMCSISTILELQKVCLKKI